ncbi:MAG: YkgJ family cysteine cluster protein [Dehalococcoidales bacterium]|nr:YkgJ family cysteine cluster protein [Dehalococcoidales bacterium]
MLQAFIQLRSLQHVFDEAEGVLEETLGTPICVRGCGKCCECNTPLASIIEGINLVSINMMDQAKIKRLVQTCEGWLLEPHGNKIFKGVPLGFQSGPIMEEWKRTSRQQCPLMLENKDCLIHQDRPLSCRAFGVFRDAVDICPRKLGKGETSLSRGVISSRGVRPLVDEFYESCKKRQPVWAIRCFVPTVIFRAASPKKFQEYIAENKIASAKLIGMDIDTSLMWQAQLDQLRQGKTPDQVFTREVIDGISA